MFALSERHFLRKRSAKSADNIDTPPPENIRNPESILSPLEFIKGAGLRGKGEKWCLGKAGETKLSLVPSCIIEITEANFSKYLAVTKERVAKFGDAAWQYDETFDVTFPEQEQRKRDEIREYLYDLHKKQENLPEAEKLKQKDSIVVRVVETDDSYPSGGRTLKVVISNLIVGHSNNREVPPPLELYTVSTILPIGATKEDVFSYFSEGQNLDFAGEAVKVIQIPTTENISPRFKIARELFYELLERSEKETQLNKEQIIDTIKWLDVKMKTDIHPGAFAYSYQDKKTGRIYCVDEYGDVVPIILMFDNQRALLHFVTNFENVRQNAKVGQVTVYRPEGGGISAGTSKLKPNKTAFENPTVEGPDGKIYMFTDTNDLINFWQQNFPEIPLEFLPETQARTNIIPEFNLGASFQTLYDPSILPRRTPDIEIVEIRLQQSDMYLSSIDRTIIPFILLIPVITDGRADSFSINRYEEPPHPSYFFQESPIIPVKRSQSALERGISERETVVPETTENILHNEFRVNQHPAFIAIPTHIEQTTYFIPQSREPQGGGGGENQKKSDSVGARFSRPNVETDLSAQAGDIASREQTEQQEKTDSVGAYCNTPLRAVVENNIHTVGAGLSRENSRESSRPTVETHLSAQAGDIASLHIEYHSQITDQSVDHSLGKTLTEETAPEGSSRGRNMTQHISTKNPQATVVYKGFSLSKQGESLPKIIYFPPGITHQAIILPNIIPPAEIGTNVGAIHELPLQYQNLYLWQLAFQSWQTEGYDREDLLQKMQLALPQLPPQATSALLGLFFLIFLNLASGNILLS